MLTCRVGSGKEGLASSSACARSATSVSPIWVLVSFATATMSPGPACAMFDWSLPNRPRMLPMRSSSLWVAFQRWSCAFRLPDTTRKKVRRPTKGSAVVLKTCATNGPDGSGAISLPSAVVRPPTSAADGTCLAIMVVSSRTPMFFSALPTKTGTTLPSRVPLCSASSISASLISSPSRYLFISSSDASAAASTRASRRCSSPARSSSGMGASFGVPPS